MVIFDLSRRVSGVLSITGTVSTDRAPKKLGWWLSSVRKLQDFRRNDHKLLFTSTGKIRSGENSVFSAIGSNRTELNSETPGYI